MCCLRVLPAPNEAGEGSAIELLDGKESLRSLKTALPSPQDCIMSQSSAFIQP